MPFRRELLEPAVAEMRDRMAAAADVPPATAEAATRGAFERMKPAEREAYRATTPFERPPAPQVPPEPAKAPAPPTEAPAAPRPVREPSPVEPHPLGTPEPRLEAPPARPVAWRIPDAADIPEGYHVERLRPADVMGATEAWQRLDMETGKGPSGIPGRLKVAKKFIASGEPVDLPRIVRAADGSVSFVDGRHRVVAAAQTGASDIPFLVQDEPPKEAHAAPSPIVPEPKATTPVRVPTVEAKTPLSRPEPGKAPWQMTEREWFDAWENLQINYTGSGGMSGGSAIIGRDRSGKSLAKLLGMKQDLKMGLPDRDVHGIPSPARHFQVIEHAIGEGLPVPEHVLRAHLSAKERMATEPESAPAPEPSRPEVPARPRPAAQMPFDEPAGTRATRSIYDERGRKYSYYVATDIPSDHIVTSHTASGAPDARYRADFQSRDFDVQRARELAASLDEGRLAPEGSSFAAGAPVVWRDPETGLYHVVAGNHRQVARAIAGKPGAVRVLDGTLEEAKQAAAASQRSDAAPESTIERARATVRSLGLTAADVPRNVGAEPITKDTVAAFVTRNPSFARKVLGPRGAAEPGAAAEAVNAALTGLLPEGAQRAAQALGEKVEQAVAASAPALLDLHNRAKAGEVRPEFDLLARLDRAAQALEAVGGKKGRRDIVRRLNDAAETPNLPGMPEDPVRQLDQPDAGVLLGLASMEGRAAPAAAMAEAVARVRNMALSAEFSPKQGGLFGAASSVDPLAVVAEAFGERVAAHSLKFRPAGGGVGAGPLMAFTPGTYVHDVVAPALSKVADGVGKLFRANDPALPGGPSSAPAGAEAKQAAQHAAGQKTWTRRKIDAWREVADNTVKLFEDWGKLYAQLEPFEGTGITKGEGGKNLSLMHDARFTRKEQMVDAPTIAHEAAADVTDHLKTPSDYKLLQDVLDLRDASHMVAKNRQLVEAKAEAQAVKDRLDVVKKRRVNGLSKEEQAEYDAAKETLRRRPRKLYVERTPEEVESLRADREARLKDSQGTQSAIAEFRKVGAENRRKLENMGYDIPDNPDYFMREVIHEDVEGGGVGGKGSAGFKKVRPKSTLKRGGSDKPTSLDVPRLLYEQTRQINEQYALWKFANELRKSEHNLLNHIKEQGALPEGTTINDVTFWSFDQYAPDIGGVSAKRLLAAVSDRFQKAQDALVEALDAGDTAAAMKAASTLDKEVVHAFRGGKSRQYILLPKTVADTLTSISEAPKMARDAITVGVRALHRLFRTGTLVYHGGIGYLERNLVGDTGNMLNLVSTSSPFDMARDVGGVVKNAAEIQALQVREAATGVLEPKLERLRKLHALQSGFIGSGIPEGVLLPERLVERSPVGKAAHAVKEAVAVPFRAVHAGAAGFEAAPRATAIDALLRRGYNEAGASIVANQFLVDYALVDPTMGAVRTYLAPFVTYTIQNFRNYGAKPLTSLPLAAKIIVPYVLWNYWNTVGGGEKVKENEALLPEYVAARPHITLPEKDEHGRPRYVNLEQLAPVQQPVQVKAGLWALGRMASAGLARAGYEEASETVGERSGAMGWDAASDAAMAFSGPLVGGAAAMGLGVDIRTGRPLERERDRQLSPESRAEETAERFHVPTPVAKALGIRGSAAVSPFLGMVDPARAFAADGDRPMREADIRRRFMGSPVRAVEPDARYWEARAKVPALRETFQASVAELDKIVAAMDAKPTAEERKALDAKYEAAATRGEKALAGLKERGIQDATIKAWITEMKKAEAVHDLTEEERRAMRQAKAGVVPTAPRAQLPVGRAGETKESRAAMPFGHR